jgi:hypothetical protein
VSFERAPWPMERELLLVASLAMSVAGCASRSPAVAISPAEQTRCEAVSDSVSKYISTDALPFAHLVGDPRLLRTPAAMAPGDSASVEFVVKPDGMADTSSVLVGGASDPEFVRSALAFAAQSRFAPAQVQGCNVVSRYNLVVKARSPGS